MGWIPVHEDIKVPVIKNIIYAFKILYKCHKPFMLWQILAQCSYMIFTLFIQSVLFLKTLLSAIEGSEDFRYYVKILLIFFAIGIVNELIAVYTDYKGLVDQKKIFKALNNMIFEKAAEVDISCYEDPEFYDKYQRATEILTGGLFIAFSYTFAAVIGGLISFISVIGIVASINTVYLIFLAPILPVFAVEVWKSRVVYKRDLKMTTNNRIKSYAQRTVFLKDYAKDMRTSNIFSVIKNRFDRAVNSNIKILKSYGMKLFLFSMISSFLGELIPIAGTYAFAGYQFIVTKALAVSGFSVVLSSINSVREATTRIADSFSELSAVALYFQNLHDFFDYKSKIVSGSKKTTEFESLEFKNVSFKYPSAESYSLKNISLKINKGETTAVVGINGAGKTTFVKLLLRFYDVTEGEILYNGINIKEYELDDLRDRFATVFQDYKNFALSVNENVLCRICSEEDKETARQALIKSGVYDKINSLDKGADTVLTREFDENGTGLSGGEAQKTAAARMFAKDFDIAILDEPSSALDPIAEYNMYENLIAATREKTVIYISHRLSSAVLSDKIFVLGGGSLLEKGTHNELMNANGEYAKMFALQASSYNKEGGIYE